MFCRFGNRRSWKSIIWLWGDEEWVDRKTTVEKCWKTENNTFSLIKFETGLRGRGGREKRRVGWWIYLGMMSVDAEEYCCCCCWWCYFVANLLEFGNSYGKFGGLWSFMRNHQKDKIDHKIFSSVPNFRIVWKIVKDKNIKYGQVACHQPPKSIWFEFDFLENYFDSLSNHQEFSFFIGVVQLTRVNTDFWRQTSSFQGSCIGKAQRSFKKA